MERFRPGPSCQPTCRTYARRSTCITSSNQSERTGRNDKQPTEPNAPVTCRLMRAQQPCSPHGFCDAVPFKVYAQIMRPSASTVV